jgi:acylphosphatase
VPQVKVAAEIYVSGRVQGVGYRFFTERLAAGRDITGWSMNLPDGRVMLEVEGDRPTVERFVAELKVGPRTAWVSEVAVTWKPYQGRYRDFFIKV